MDEISNYYNQDINFYKDFLRKNNISYKQMINYFSGLDHNEDKRFDFNNYYLQRKLNCGFEKLTMSNEDESYTFYVSSYQTTNAQFHSFLKHSDYKCNYKYPKNEHNHPVAWVSWHDAVAYTKWINKIFKSKLINEPSVKLSNNFKELLNDRNYQISLLSETEWLYSANSGKKITYPWGNYLSLNCCNYKTSKLEKTCPVGCYFEGVSESGLFDLSGNTWEWLRTKWGPSLKNRIYKSQTGLNDDRNNIDTEKNFLRSMKGGSFLVESKRLKINFEDAVPPESIDDGDGLRIGLVKLL